MLHPPKFESGKPIMARDLNALSGDSLRDVVLGPGMSAVLQHGVLMMRRQEDLFFRKSPVIFAQVVAAYGDYLECTYYDPVADVAGATVYIAKPFMLRQTPFDGETITYLDGSSITYAYTTQRERAADDGVDSETQVMTPDYYVGEVIRATRGNTGVVDGDTKRLGWEDMNTCGRFWAKEAS